MEETLTIRFECDRCHKESDLPIVSESLIICKSAACYAQVDVTCPSCKAAQKVPLTREQANSIFERRSSSSNGPAASKKANWVDQVSGSLADMPEEEYQRFLECCRAVRRGDAAIDP